MNEAIERIALALERIARAIEARAGIPPEALCKEDAAKFIGVDVGAIEHLIRTRRLAYVQTGDRRGRVIPLESLREFLQEYLQDAMNGKGGK